LKSVYADDDPTPARIIETLNKFYALHARLSEWKHLHNHMSIILIISGVFIADLRTNGSGLINETDANRLRTQWCLVEYQLIRLVEWAKNLKIISKPYRKTKKNAYGPKWVTEVIALHDIIKLELENDYPKNNRDKLKSFSNSFDNEVKKSLTIADQNILNTVGELENTSQVFFKEDAT